MGVILKGWKYVGFIAGIVGFIGVAIYPIVVAPLMNVDKYSKYIILTKKNCPFISYLQKKYKNVLDKVLIKKKSNLEVRNLVLCLLKLLLHLFLDMKVWSDPFGRK